MIVALKIAKEVLQVVPYTPQAEITHMLAEAVVNLSEENEQLRALAELNGEISRDWQNKYNNVQALRPNHERLKRMYDVLEKELEAFRENEARKGY